MNRDALEMIGAAIALAIVVLGGAVVVVGLFRLLLLLAS